jgi:vitamin-K-epoxide reductase (warfarin-sensitive)
MVVSTAAPKGLCLHDTPVDRQPILERWLRKNPETDRLLHSGHRRKMKSMKYLIALLAVAGIVVSTMALRVHYMDPTLAPPCAVTEKFDCGAVNHSRFAVFPPRTFDEDPKAGSHIPVAMLGIVGYAAIGVVALMGRWWLVFEFAQVGFLFAAFLSYIEAYVLQKWCIYCLWSQGIVTAILVLTIATLLIRWQQGRGSRAAIASK